MNYIAFFATLALILTACTLPQTEQPAAPGEVETVQEPIKIGWYGPLTGDLGLYGTENKNAVEMAVADLNANGGLQGRTIEVVYEDSKCDAKEAVNAVTKLLAANKVVAVLGGFCSTEMLAVAPIFNENNIVNIGLGSSPDITLSGDYIFRNSPSDAAGAILLAQRAYADGHRKLALLSSNAEYPQAFHKKMREAFIAAGGTIVGEEIVDPESTDHRTAILKLSQAKPDSIFIIDKGPIQMARMAKQIREAKLTIPLYVPLAFTDEESRKAGGIGAEGAIIVDSPSLDPSIPKAKAFSDAYRTIHGKDPSLAFYVAASYDSVYILRDVLAQCPALADPCIKEKLYGVKDFSGALGTYDIDENGDIQGIPFVFRTIKDGKVVDLPS